MFNERLLAKSRWIDRLLSRCFSLGNIFRKPFPDVPLDSIQPKQILVLESHLIGDSIMSIPVLLALRERFPESSIDVLGNEWAGELLRDQGYVHQVFTVKIPWATYDYSPRNLLAVVRVVRRLRRCRYDLAMDPRGDMRNNCLLWMIAATRRLGYAVTGGAYFLTDIAPVQEGPIHLVKHRLAVLSPLGIETSGHSPVLSVPHTVQERAGRILLECGVGRQFVVIHPGASIPERKWDRDKHGELIRRLHEAGMKVVIVGGPRDTNDLIEIGRVAGVSTPTIQVSLMELAAILRQCSVLVSMDSGAAHIGAAVGCPVIVLYGMADPRVVRPLGQSVDIMMPPDGTPASPNSIEVDVVIETLIKRMTPYNTPSPEGSGSRKAAGEG